MTLAIKQGLLDAKGYYLRVLTSPANRDSKHLFECLECQTQFERPLSKILNRGQSGCPNGLCPQSSASRRKASAKSQLSTPTLPSGVLLIEQKGGNSPSVLQCSCGVTLHKILANFTRRSTDLWCHNPSCSHFNPKFQTVGEVRQMFVERGVTSLFSTYSKSPDEPLAFLCSCGKEAVTNYRFLLKRNRHGISHPPTCPECKNSNRPRGELSPCWDHSISEEQRIKERRVWNEEGLPYKSWRRSVHIKDSGRCVISGKRNTPSDPIRVHHIFNYRHHEEGRILTANGVCLSESLHRRFHQEYGHGENTLRQFKEFYSKILGRPYINAELELIALQFGWDHG